MLCYSLKFLAFLILFLFLLIILLTLINKVIYLKNMFSSKQIILIFEKKKRLEALLHYNPIKENILPDKYF